MEFKSHKITSSNDVLAVDIDPFHFLLYRKLELRGKYQQYAVFYLRRIKSDKTEALANIPA
jgi:hypothetical protein